ncbi:hypothetical protein GCM10010317_076990 [Streptomyces mirabilis]|uniref:hypothetical protein n=1 Tax=Streptomyces mirabilis TaxID=68239 RepID=UPI00167DE3C8|nr:hypothetical protein [Streptomyces mirabilis]GHD70195.1 hypothetical protein GCM10010317_076990 [Streptomyces mirabilis]
MPSLSTLVDNFNDGTVGPDWGNAYGGVTESGGRAHVPCGTGYAGYQTAYSWTMAGATFFVAVTTVPAASTATEAYASVFVNAPDIATSGIRVGFVINTVTGLLKFSSETGYYDPGAVTVTYNATTHKFLRLREDGTNVYWDTSPDGSTWTNQRTLATPAWVTASIDTCALDLSAHRDAGTPDEAQYDLFNTLSDGAVWTATAALTADSSLAGAALVSARAAADLAADSTLGAAAALSAHAAADLTGEATLAADADASGIPEVASLSAGDWDLYIEQGSTFVQTYTVTDEGFTWAGWSARSQIRSAPADSGEILLDLTPYLAVIGAAIRLAIPATQTQTITRNGVWDLEVYQGSTVVRLLNGRAIVSPEVTR